MQHEFSRTELLIGQRGLEKLRQSTVMIFGIGGVGSFTVEALARAGIGHLILVDYDEICLTNINRQLHALHSTVGLAKVEVMKQRILEINPQAKVEAIKKFYSAADADFFLNQTLDYVIDAIDTVSSKVNLAKECLQREISFISSMGAGNRLSAQNYRVSDISKTSGDPLAKAMRKLLRKEGISKGIKVVFSPDSPQTPLSAASECQTNCICPSGDAPCAAKHQIPGSISFVPPVVGLLLAGEVIRDLLNTLGSE
ncbi:dinucleotide-utilizing enzyme possibly involved in molybdopterin or thiamin biosynthesis [Desulfosporosinus orientis DSM 765]|uniref:Dinucleotide-utilizing enzyme possibly involved in molybdopterin or thiamin biosynthesis n=1 Tax=Desulfosporosinus orientis (strain ATCC 19365 / DSM 765 / NCIMB 8382 / VKM B-1628 / Singapore I) TaxID=768706 RepID=G7WEC8_DESOD|nr:tRNA threonylcarbamoyladenosine dehydratase [Desulfosporosinus orientis]AET70741.1 dinucleotide-utilizing enzyme possibly involved in molybdopterin or thiamin biosynthesis [Desulfosporosinus orientis DSM 765]